jgi:hypothetical protein
VLADFHHKIIQYQISETDNNNASKKRSEHSVQSTISKLGAVKTEIKSEDHGKPKAKTPTKSVFEMFKPSKLKTEVVTLSDSSQSQIKSQDDEMGSEKGKEPQEQNEKKKDNIEVVSLSDTSQTQRKEKEKSPAKTKKVTTKRPPPKKKETGDKFPDL